MRIAVIGAGGVGGYFGARLAAAGADVTFVVRGRTLDVLRRRGIRVESIAGDFTVPNVKATDSPSDPVDAILMATKAWQLREAAEQVRPIVGPETVVVPLQNGIDAPEQLASVLGESHVAGGLCAIVAFVEEPGVIRHIGAEPLIAFGEMDGRPSERLERLRDVIVAAGIKCEIPPDIRRSMWTKFVFIAPFSGVGSITRMPVGTWRTVPETRSLAERAVAEVIALAGAAGVRLDDDAGARTMARYDALPPASTPSMQRDIEGGRPSELEAQLGDVVRLGRKHGVPTPLHEWMYAALLPAEGAARAAAGMT
ncbi:MAG TPA: 2-dehydropantoate 2-reductase [Thermoanaerobaculia bacterium]|nr:2-dehydropantoate 2-reductase [Thermoanaerobaculia bacterium]